MYHPIAANCRVRKVAVMAEQSRSGPEQLREGLLQNSRRGQRVQISFGAIVPNLRGSYYALLYR